MGLGRILIKLGKEAFMKSKSLLSVHLTQNNLGLLDVEEFLELMGVDHTEVITQIRKSMGAAEQEDTAGHRGQPSDSVKMMAYLCNSPKHPSMSTNPRKAPR